MSTAPFKWGRGSTPYHSIEELNGTALAAQAGDERAKEKLVYMMRPYIVNLLRKVPGDYTKDQRDEMTAAALVGLFEALRRYDPAKQAETGKRKFSNYALNWIRHEVFEWQAKNSRSLPVPRKAWGLATKLEEEWQKANPEVAIEIATDEQLGSLELVVQRGLPGSVTRGSHRGEKESKAITVDYAGDILRAKKQPHLYDPDYHTHEASDSAEDVFFDTWQDPDEAAILRQVEVMISEAQEIPDMDERLYFLVHGVADHGWDPAVIPLLIEQVEL